MSWFSFSKATDDNSEVERKTDATFQPPMTATLPNGKQPPRICGECRVPAEQCQHKMEPCDKCKLPRSACSCQPFKVVAATATPEMMAAEKKKKATTAAAVPEKPKSPEVKRIDDTIALLDRLGERVLTEKSEKAANDWEKIRETLDQQGLTLLRQCEILAEFESPSIVSEQMLESHAAALKEWHEICDAFVCKTLRQRDFFDALSSIREKLDQNSVVK